MIEFFQSIPLKGKVWLAGGIVSDPTYSPASPSYAGVEVFLEVANDKAAINTTMKNQFPEVWGHIVYHTGEPNPDEPSILVFDPEAGEEEFDMGEGAPPGMEQAGLPAEGAGLPPEMDIEAAMSSIGQQL
jgi:hypothetical protein